MMKNQLAGLMKQAQAMQENMKRAQEELASVEVEGQSGAGLVKVVMTCKHDVRRIAIDPSLLDEDKDMVEDLVAAFLAAPRAVCGDFARQPEQRGGQAQQHVAGGEARHGRHDRHDHRPCAHRRCGFWRRDCWRRESSHPFVA